MTQPLSHTPLRQHLQVFILFPSHTFSGFTSHSQEPSPLSHAIPISHHFTQPANLCHLSPLACGDFCLQNLSIKSIKESIKRKNVNGKGSSNSGIWQKDLPRTWESMIEHRVVFVEKPFSFIRTLKCNTSSAKKKIDAYW